MLGDVVQEDVEVQGERLGHAVLRVVGGEIVVPLPSLPGERHLRVDLRLLDVKPVGAENLPRGFNESRVPAEAREDLVPEMKTHDGPDLAARLLADVGRSVFREQMWQLRAQDVDLHPGEERRKDQEALDVEIRKLGYREPHESRIIAAVSLLSR